VILAVVFDYLLFGRFIVFVGDLIFVVVFCGSGVRFAFVVFFKNFVFDRGVCLIVTAEFVFMQVIDLVEPRLVVFVIVTVHSLYSCASPYPKHTWFLTSTLLKGSSKR
jgi:hypothetical protein